MTPQQVAQVQDSFARVVPIADEAARIFYGRLFELDPDLRNLFPQRMEDQRRKLMQTLGVAVQNLHDLPTLAPVARELGARHVGYGVHEAHYDLVGKALLHTLEVGLGPAWTPALREAWEETFGLIAGEMKDGAREVWKEGSG